LFGRSGLRTKENPAMRETFKKKKTAFGQMRLNFVLYTKIVNRTRNPSGFAKMLAIALDHLLTSVTY
jgi:hypothetical protein